jgi:hypothetical protein
VDSRYYAECSAFLSAAGYAEYRPSVSNETREGRAINRRVDVVVRENISRLREALLKCSAGALARENSWPTKQIIAALQ